MHRELEDYFTVQYPLELRHHFIYALNLHQRDDSFEHPAMIKFFNKMARKKIKFRKETKH